MPRLPWKHSPARKNWRAVKAKHSKTITQAFKGKDFKFDLALGKQLDKLDTLLKKKSSEANDRALQTVAVEIKKIVRTYKLNVKGIIGGPAEKELLRALNVIGVEAKKIDDSDEDVSDDEASSSSSDSSDSDSDSLLRLKVRPNLTSARRPPTKRGTARKTTKPKTKTTSTSKTAKKQTIRRGKLKVSQTEEEEQSEPETTDNVSLAGSGRIPVDQQIPLEDIDDGEVSEGEMEEDSVKLDQPINIGDLDDGEETEGYLSDEGEDEDEELLEAPPEQAPQKPPKPKRGKQSESLAQGQSGVEVVSQGSRQSQSKTDDPPQPTRRRRGTFGATQQTDGQTETDVETPEPTTFVPRTRRGTFGNAPPTDDETENEVEEQVEPQATPSKPKSQDENVIPTQAPETGGEKHSKEEEDDEDFIEGLKGENED